VLLQDGNPGLRAVTPDQHLDHIRNAPVLARSGFAHCVLDDRLDAQIECRDLGTRHALHYTDKKK
jgi:hypothetical protein